jgi:hypothetical protein
MAGLSDLPAWEPEHTEVIRPPRALEVPFMRGRPQAAAHSRQFRGK